MTPKWPCRALVSILCHLHSQDCLRQAQSTAGAHDGTVCAGYKRLASIGGGSREDRDALRLLIHAQVTGGPSFNGKDR